MIRGICRDMAAFEKERRIFLALIATQAAHSVEEYAGGLYASFPPAMFVSGLISSDLERGFVIANIALVTFGVWCYLWPIRRRWPSAVTFAWAWTGVELINGVGHPLWSLAQASYTPGVATAPVLFVLGLALARELTSSKEPPAS
jgi:hypothetical protein